jgi:hypothetical protein
VGVSEEAAKMLADKVLAQTPLTHQEAFKIAMVIKGMNEDGGMGTAAVAPTLEPVRVKKVDEDVNSGYTRVPKGHANLKSIEVMDLWAEDINEARNYNQFKKQAATRTKSQQMHEAAKMIHKKLEEINRLLEYTSQMKNELAEGEEQMEYKHNTKKVFEKINTKVVETYSKVKKLK